jgi:hypothetical protein
VSDDGRLVSISPWRCECGYEARDLAAMRRHDAEAHPAPQTPPAEVVRFAPRPPAEPRCPRWPHHPPCASACPGAEACAAETGAAIARTQHIAEQVHREWQTRDAVRGLPLFDREEA